MSAAQPWVDAITAAAAVWCGGAALDALRERNRRARVIIAAMRAWLADLRAQNRAVAGESPAPEPRPAAWLDAASLDTQALQDVGAAMIRLRATFGKAPSDAECAAMLMVCTAQYNSELTGDAPPVRVAQAAIRAAKAGAGDERRA